MTRDELKKARDALIANHNTEHMTALLKETMDQSPPDPDLPHQERERILAEWLLPGAHEHDVVGHQAQDGVDVARHAGPHPGGDQLAYGAFVDGHVFKGSPD